jgi:hypothetical protein
MGKYQPIEGCDLRHSAARLGDNATSRNEKTIRQILMHANQIPRLLVSADPTLGPDQFFGAPCCCSFSSCSSFIFSISSSCALLNFGNRNTISSRMPQGDAPAGYFAFPKN